MLTSIRRYLTAPIFEDEVKTRTAFLLHTLSLLILLILILSVALSPVISTLIGATMNYNQVISLFITRAGFLVILSLITLILTRAGYVRQASAFFVLAAWLMVTSNVYRSGGVLSLAFINYLLPIILAGLFLGIRPAIVYSTLSFIAGGIFFYLSNNNQLPAYEPLTPFGSLIFGGVSFALVALIISLYVHRLRETLGLLQNANQELENAGKTLEKHVEERTRALSSSAAISRRLSTILNPDQLMLEVVEQIQTAFNYSHGQIYLLDKSKQTLILAGATGEVGKTLLAQNHQVSLEQGLVGKVARTKMGVVVPDVSKEPAWLPNPLLPTTQAEVTVPILLGSELLGVLDMQATQVNHVSEEDLELIQAIANQVAIALQNSRQYEETQMLFRASQALATSTTYQEILNSFMIHAAPHAHQGGLLVFEIDEEDSLLAVDYVAAWSGHPDRNTPIPAGTRFLPEQIPFTKYFVNNQPLIIADVHATTPGPQTASPEVATVLQQFGVQSMAGYPLILGGKLLGALLFGYEHPHLFMERELQPVQVIASQMAVLLRNQQLLAQTQITLTQLDVVNRRLIGEGWREFTKITGGIKVEDIVPGTSLTDFEEAILESKNGAGDFNKEITVPLTVRGEEIGAFRLQHLAEGAEFKDEDLELLQNVADEVSLALENIRLLEETQQNALALEESRNLLDAVIENLPLLLFVKDAKELRYIRWNKAGENMLGISAPEVLGKNAYDSFNKEEADRFTAQDWEILSGEKFLDISEETVETPRGTRILHTRKTPVFSPDGQARYLVGLSEDITERKEAEKALQELETLYRRAIASADAVPYSRRYADESFSFVGEKIQDLTGYAPHEFTTSLLDTLIQETVVYSIKEVTHPDAVRLTRTGKMGQWKADYRIRTRDGSERWLSDSSVEIVGPDGVSTGSVGIMTDITDRKRAEEALNQQLQEMENLNSIGQIIVSQQDLVSLVTLTGTKICEAFKVDTGYIALYDSRADLIQVPFYLDGGESLSMEPQPFGTGLASRIMQTRQPLLLNEMTPEMSERLGVYHVGKQPATSWLGVPILSGEEILGVISLQHSTQPYRFSDKDTQLLSTIAANLSTAIQNIRLLEQTQTTLDDLAQLTRRLTRESWQNYVNTTSEELGYVYDLMQVAPISADLSANGTANGTDFVQQPLVIQGETIGQLVVEETNEVDQEALELLNAVSAQLSAHIENLRLLEETEQNRAQLQRNEARLAEALHIARLGHWEYDVEKDLFTFNDQFYSIFHTTAEKVGGYQLPSAKYAELFVHPEDMPIVGAEIERALNSTERVYNTQLEHRINFMDGGLGYISVQITLERDENGKITRYYGANQDITERKQAELILRESEARLSEALRIARLGYWETNIKTRTFTFDDHFYAIFHTTAEEMGGYQMSEVDYIQRFVHPEDASFLGKEIEKALTTPGMTATRIEHRILYMDGGVGYVLVEANIERSEDGSPLRIFGTTQDITELKQAEQDLAESTHQIELILGTAGEGIFSLDENGNHILVNPAAAQMLGFEASELVGSPSHSLWHHSRPDGSPYPDEECPIYFTLRDGIIHRGEEYFWRKDGTGFPISFTSQPIIEKGRITGAVVTFQDITRQKQTQEILTRRASELQTVATLSTTASTVLNPAELLQAVVNLTKERFNLYHAHVYLTNEAESTMDLAYGAGEVGRQLVTEQHAIPMDTEKSLVARAVRERKAVIVNDVQADPGFLPNPILPNTRSEMAIPMIAGEKVLGVFDVQADQVKAFSQEDANIFTTLASQVAVALQNARLYVEQAATVQRLRELDYLKSSFLANMSHELRTPLNSIIGFTEIILEGIDGPLTEFMEGDLKIIQKNGKHLLSLINDVLDMAKIEAGRMNLTYERFMLRELLEDVVDITTSLAHDKQLYLRIDSEDAEEIELVADRIRLRQVLINLVGNAVKFTETGGVTLRSERKDGKLWLKVIDTGIGIPSENLETVFEYFSQVDTSTTRKAGGTGLGLPISRRLVELHNGQLWAESSGEEGQGSTFNLVLPVDPLPNLIAEG